MDWNAHQGTPSQFERWSPRADADAHAGAVANATMPRHRHATLSVRERAVGVPFATARAISPASTLERRGCRQPVSTLERFLCALSASQPRPCGARLGTRASRSSGTLREHGIRYRPRFAATHSRRRVHPMHTPRSAAPAPHTKPTPDCAAWRRHPRSGYDARACASGPPLGTMRQPRRLPPGTVPDSVRFSPLHFTPLRGCQRTAPLACRFTAFRSAA